MLAQKIAAYLGTRMPSARDLEVLNFKRISGGSSRETYSFDLRCTEGGASHLRPMILRRDPTGGLLESSREREFRTIDAMCKSGLKVPAALFLELDSAPLERPFFVMERAEGRVSSGAVPEVESAALRAKLASEFLDQLVALQRLDWKQLNLGWLADRGDLENPARAQTAHWLEIYNRDRMGESYPILSAAFSWLEANPVKADRIALVHGDFRAGNFLYDERGLLSLLDWEMAHLGDPMEDLGWATMRFWGREELAGGMIDREEFCRLYERKSGGGIDRARLFFYQVLGNAKMSVICLTGIRAYVEGKTPDVVMPFLEFLLSPLFDELAAQLKLI